MSGTPDTSLERAITGQMNGFELVEMVPIPISGDRMVRLRTLEEALDDFEQTDDGETVAYIVHVRPKRPNPLMAEPEPAPVDESKSAGQTAESNVYLPDGKLNVPFLLRNAELLFSTGEYNLCRRIHKAILKSGERTATAHFGLGRCFQAEGKIEDAILHYEESIAYQPSAETYRSLAMLLIQQKRDAQAAEVLERALLLKDLSSAQRQEFYQVSGNCWARMQRVPDAERQFHRALEINPNSEEIRANLGVVCLQAGKISEAKRHFLDVLATNSRSEKALAGLGSCAISEGDRRAAHDYFARSLEIQVNQPQAIYHLVKCAYEIKSYATAARILEEYVQSAPVNANLMYSLAGLQFHLGRLDASRATAHRVLEFSPQHAGAKELLEMIDRYSAPQRR